MLEEIVSVDHHPSDIINEKGREKYITKLVQKKLTRKEEVADEGDSQRLILPVVDDGPLLAHVAVRLQPEVPLEHRREAVALQQPHQPHRLLPVLGDALQVQQHRYVVACNSRLLVYTPF